MMGARDVASGASPYLSGQVCAGRAQVGPRRCRPAGGHHRRQGAGWPDPHSQSGWSAV